MPYLANRRGDFEDWVASPVRHPDLDISVITPSSETPLPTPEQFCGVVITGSHAMVTDKESWSEHTAGWIPDIIAKGVPLLGICYGHQLIAHAMGGIVDNLPSGLEIGTVTITPGKEALTDPLFSIQTRAFKAHVSHSQTVIKLPHNAQLLASSANEPHHAFSLGDRTWGVQFHPEFDADIMKTYVKEHAGLMRAHGQDPDKALAKITETPHSSIFLNRFVKLSLSYQESPNTK